MNSVNTEELVEAFIALRDQREKLLHEYEAADKLLKAEQTQLEQALLQICNQINADSIKTPRGTVMKKLNERFFCDDWDNFYRFVLENEAVQLLERRIHQSNFREFMKDSVGDGLPPGVNVMREYGVSVRKATR